MPNPAYRYRLKETFPELPNLSTGTQDARRPAPLVALTLAHLAAGNKFVGPTAELTMDEILEELEVYCIEHSLDLDRAASWADSLLEPPETTLPEDLRSEHLITEVRGPGFSLHPYQLDVAAWAAHRMGSVLSLGCGVGKTATSVSAAGTAARIGKCSSERCVIVCPLNAVGTWAKYKQDLLSYFKQVDILSVDSLHKYKAMDRSLGGALIFDEAHKLKTVGKRRTESAHVLRAAFEWCTCLTGSLLHTGPEGVMSVLDLACPGLARFFDIWKFGDTFNCVSVTQVPGRGMVRKLELVPFEMQPRFVEYLKRGVRSLAVSSPEVREHINLPEHTVLSEDSWETPGWVQDLNEETENGTVVYQGHTLHTYSQEEIESFAGPPPTPPVITAANTPASSYLGALALAMMHQRQEQLFETLKERGFPSTTVEEAVEYIRESEDEVTFGDLKELQKMCGLPHFSAVCYEVTKEGRENRAIARVKEEYAGVQTISYRFIYPEGEERWGPKLQALRQWLEDNPEEQVVVGAAAVKTLDDAEALLQELGISYHLIRGGVATKDRVSFIEKFQRGETRVMLLQQVAGSESVDLYSAATSILLDHSWSPAVYTQFQARTHRQGQTRPCTHIDYVYGPVQEMVVSRLRRGESFDAAVRQDLEQQVQYH